MSNDFTREQQEKLDSMLDQMSVISGTVANMKAVGASQEEFITKFLQRMDEMEVATSKLLREVRKIHLQNKLDSNTY